jgi:hypothetical protein
MKIRMLKDYRILANLKLIKDHEYRVASRSTDDKGWLIEVRLAKSMKQAFVPDEDCIVIKDSLFTKIKRKLTWNNGG